MTAQWIGDCQDARDWYGVSIECDHVGHDHPSRMYDIEDESCFYLLCRPVFEAVEFVIDSREPIERLGARIYSLNLAMDRLGFKSAPAPAKHLEATASLGDPVPPCGDAGPGRLPVMYKADPIAWAASEGIEFWGWTK